MIKTTLIGLAVAALLAACANSSPDVTPNPAAATSGSTGASTTTGSESQVATVMIDPLDDPKSKLAERSVYFAYDDFTVSPKYQTLLQAHGSYLQAHPQTTVRIEGNTDERGSHEYNLSLGDKRAQIVAKQLELLGVKAAQIEAVSFGEERPRTTDNTEAAWSENRRADIHYMKR